MKFSTKLSMVIAVVFLTGSVAMFYIGYTSTTGIVEQNVRERLEGEAFQVIDKIDRTLFERYADMSVLAGDPVLRSRTSTPLQITQRLGEYQGKYHIYSSLSFFSMNRVRLADTAGKNIGEQHAMTEYWQELAAGRNVIMAITESQSTKHIVIHFNAVVRDAQGRKIGVIASRMPIESVYNIADQTFRRGKDREPLNVELLDANGLILYSSYHRAGMLREVSGDWEHIRGLLAQGKSVGSVRHALAGEEDEITAFAREQGYDTFKGNNWVLSLCVPIKTVFLETDAQARKITVLFLGIGMAMILSTFLISRAATNPLHELSRAAAEIGKGNRDVSVKVRSEDEIGLLANAFNAMVLKLKESENKYKTLVEMLPQVVYEIDTTGKVTFVNQYGLKIFGYTRQEFEEGIHIPEIIVPEDHVRLMENTNKALSGDKVENVELTALRKDRRTFPFLVFIVPMRHDGTVVGMRGIGIDITARKAAEEALRANVLKYRALIETTDTGFVIIDAKGRVLDANQEYIRLTDHNNLEDIIGRSVTEWTVPEDQERNAREVALCMERGYVRNLEIAYRRGDGVTPIEINATVIRDIEGPKILTLCRDITDRKQREQELREGEEKLRRITETARDAIVMMDDEGCISFWNPAAEKIFGYSSGETRGKELHTCLSPARYYEAYKKGFEHFRQTGEGTAVGKTLELDAVRKGGSEFKVELSLSSLRINGKWNAVGIMRDITERKQSEETIKKMNSELEHKVAERTKQLLDAQEELVRKERLSLLGQLAGSVGHELRNPLGVISNAIYYLKTVLSGSDTTVREYLNIIKAEVDNSERIISDLLGLSRVKQPQTRSIEIDDLITKTIAKCTIPESILLHIELPPSLPPVKIDPFQISQVFQNLITNAVQAMPVGGVLRVSARMTIDEGRLMRDAKSSVVPASDASDHPSFVEVSFADTGEGIASENMKKLFQPLFTTKARGIGLGLAVSRRNVEANGGRIEVESEAGKGTTFSVHLPVAV